jgi:hypothetical protein
LSFDNLPPQGVQRFSFFFWHLRERLMIRTDHHRHVHGRLRLSQRTPAASLSNVIRISTPKRFKFFSLPQNFIRKSEPTLKHKNCPTSNKNPLACFLLNPRQLGSSLSGTQGI